MSTGFSFGAKTTAPPLGGTNTPSFGSAPSNQFSFGSNTQQQQQPPPFQLVTTLNKPTGSVLPQPGGFSLGTSSLAPSSTFGMSATTPGGLIATATPTSALSFLPSTSSTTTTGLTFGQATTAPALNFGLSTSTNTGVGGLTFGTPIASTAISTPTTGFSLSGLTSSAAPVSTPNFGTISGTSAPAPSTGLTFGVTSTAPISSFGLSTSTPGSLNFGAPAASTGFSLTTATSAAAAPSKVGLGGIQTSTANTLGNIAAKEVPPKEQQVPNEIQQDIENFKNYIKQQKSYSSDVSRCCVKDFRSVEAQIGLLNNVIKEIESQLQRNRNLAEKLKYDTAQGLQLLEMAQRTQDTPAGLQYENVAPMNFFLTLADNFEKEMHALKIQIENTDKYVKNFGQPATLTSQDLTLGMKRLHDTFVALAGRLQSVHTQVESQKELYINLRKQLANDYSNPFEVLDRKLHPSQIAQASVTHSPPKIACGPTPFNQIINTNFSITGHPNVGTSGPLAPPGFGFGSSTTSLFGNTSALNITNPGFQNTSLGSGLGFQNTNLGSSFQLQKPPTGNKRGKQ